MFPQILLSTLKPNQNILFHSVRIFFLCWFSAWSLSSFLSMQKVSYDISVQDEPYLLISQAASLNFNGIEENKKPRYSGDNDSRFLYSVKYLRVKGIHFLKPSGNYHFILLYDIPVITEINLSTDHPRPPPLV
jgi:hypothetical protein